jgi:LuxR family maltose regulon positive regulatory protein
VRMRLARQRGDLTTVTGEAQRLLASAVTADPARYDTARAALGGDLRALALIDLGIAEAWTARFDEANRHLDDGIALARQIGRPYLEVTGLAHLAQLESWRSFRLGAERGLQAIELAMEHGWADEPVAGLAYLALGVAMVTQGRIEEAERALSQAERTVRAEAEPAAGMRLHYGRGMLEFASGRHDAALSAFRAAERLANSLVTPHTLAPRLRSHLLQTLVRTGDTRRVEQALAGLVAPERGRGETRIAEASLRLAQDDPTTAAAVLRPVIDGSVVMPNAHLWDVQAFLLQAIACDTLGDAGAARRALEQALDRAAPEDLLFPFLYDPVPDLLDRHRRGAIRRAEGPQHAGRGLQPRIRAQARPQGRRARHAGRARQRRHPQPHQRAAPPLAGTPQPAGTPTTTSPRSTSQHDQRCSRLVRVRGARWRRLRRVSSAPAARLGEWAGRPW